MYVADYGTIRYFFCRRSNGQYQAKFTNITIIHFLQSIKLYTYSVSVLTAVGI